MVPMESIPERESPTLWIGAVEENGGSGPLLELSLVVESELDEAQVLGEGIGLDNRHHSTTGLGHQGWVGTLWFLCRWLRPYNIF